MRSEFDDSDYLNEEIYMSIKKKLNELKIQGWEIYKLVACIYDLWMDYILSDKQEAELYQIVDPKELYNDCGKYLYDMDYDNPLREVLI